MDRITPESVAAAFRKHPDVRPVVGEFVAFGAGDRMVGCCGSAILALDDDDRDFTMADLAAAIHPVDLIATEFGLEIEYIEGFITGWDDEDDDSDVADYDLGTDFAAGFADGVAAWQAVHADCEGEGR